MFIASIHVHHYRCIQDATLTCEPLTALVGPNGCGKSTFLKAIDLFFSTDARIAEDDFYARDTSRDIEVTLEFQDVAPIHSPLLSPYLQENVLKITRVLSWTQGRSTSKFYGYKSRHAAFASIRSATLVSQQKPVYDGLKLDPLYADLPDWTKQADLAVHLEQWEAGHPEQCTLQRDDGAFFGLGSTAKFDLSKLVQVVFIPAVRDAAMDALDNKGSPITELVDIAFRSGMSEREDFRQLASEMEARYSEIIEDAKRNQFKEVEDRLSRTMGSFVSDSSIEFVWKEHEQMSIPTPSADVVIVEDGYKSPVSRTGHGVQRAFTLTLLQEMIAARYGVREKQREKGDEAQPGDAPSTVPILLLVIEEPELYQHPNRQRSIAATLQALSQGAIPGVADQTQVIYGTHNPHFVAIDKVEQIRVLRKIQTDTGLPKSTKVRLFNPSAVMETLASCKDLGDQVGEWHFHRAKLFSIMTYTVNEGFFAEAVVLVEGDIDRAAILAACDLKGINLEDSGVSVIQCRGKANLVRLAIIFRQLGIKVYVVWDGDGGKKGKPSELQQRDRENRELQRLVGAELVEQPVTKVEDDFACFAENLEKQMKCDLGVFYDEFMGSCHERYGFSGKEGAIKHPVVFAELLMEARVSGSTSPTLDSIVSRITRMISQL